MKLFASDYDGTIRRDIVVQSDVDAINTFRAVGNKFGIVTGRSISMIESELDYFHIPYDFIIGTNGGIVVDGNLTRLYSQDIDYEKAINFIVCMKKRNEIGFGVSNGYEFANIAKGGVFANKEDTGENMRLINVKEYSVPEVLADRIINSFFIRANTEEDTMVLLEELKNSKSGFMSFHFNNGTIDGTAKGVSKSSGVHFIKKFYSLETAYVIGDGFNDIGMIQDFGGFSLTSAKQAVKSHACTVFENVGQALEFVGSL